MTGLCPSSRSGGYCLPPGILIGRYLVAGNGFRP